MKIRKRLAGLMAVVLVAGMLTGCKQLNLLSVKERSPKESVTNVSNSTTTERTTATTGQTALTSATTLGSINLVEGMSAAERKRINIFLSNFSEVGFDDYDRHTNPNLHQVVWFAYMHNAINTDKVFSKDGKMGIQAAVVDVTAERYLGIAVPHKTHENPDNPMDNWEYADGNFLHAEASGAGIGIFTVAKRMTDNGNGTFTVEFQVYELENLHDGIPDTYYEMDISTAEQNYNHAYSGTAVVIEKSYQGTDTYELVSYTV